MATTIIIPSKGDKASAGQLKLLTELFKDSDAHCIFLRIRPIPDNLNDLTTVGRDSFKARFDQSFIDAAQALKAANHKRLTISTDYIYGDSSIVFRRYAENKKADLVLYDKQEWFDSKKTTGLNVFNMVRRSGCGLMYISVEPNQLTQPPPSPEMRMSVGGAPASLMYQFEALDRRLDALQYEVANKNVVSKKINNLSRYFLNESAMDKMLEEANSSLLLIKK